MPAKPSIQDQCINQKVVRQLARGGVRPPCTVVVSTSDGSTTLSGEIEFEHQRRTAVRAATATSGVKRVVDHMQVASENSHRKQRGFAAPHLQV